MSEHRSSTDPLVLIVVESEFGNTRKIAETIADGLRGKSSADCELLPVDVAPAVLPRTVRMLVVCGPTHAFGMSTPSSREAAAQQGAKLTSGIREWINELRPRPGCSATTFDTRQSSMRHLPGSAARRAAKALRRKGFLALDKPQNFYVTGTSGPLADGELDRARAWGEHLAAIVQAAELIDRPLD